MVAEAVSHGGKLQCPARLDGEGAGACAGTIALLASLSGLAFSPLGGQVAKPVPAQEGSAPALFAGYDVVSVKPNVSGSGSTWTSTRDTTFQATNTSVKMMLKSAYGISESLISGLPKWAESSRWDINAKLVDPPPEATNSRKNREESAALYHAKVKSILTDRFHLTAHTETKILPTYELVLLPGPMRLVPPSYRWTSAAAWAPATGT